MSTRRSYRPNRRTSRRTQNTVASLQLEQLEQLPFAPGAQAASSSRPSRATCSLGKTQVALSRGSSSPWWWMWSIQGCGWEEQRVQGCTGTTSGLAGSTAWETCLVRRREAAASRQATHSTLPMSRPCKSYW